MPGSDIWELGLRSKNLWELLAKNIENQGMDPLQELGWKKTDSVVSSRTPARSLLIGGTLDEIKILEERVKQQSEAGLRALFVSGTDLQIKEPSLEVGKDCGAAFLPDDCQLDAHSTVSFLEKGNRCFVSQGRYVEFYHDPIISLLRSDQNGEVDAVQTSKNVLYSRKAVVIATGAWSGFLMQNLLKDSDIAVNVTVKPRKGHLLVLENFHQIVVKHGLMEFGYVDHQIAAPLTSSTSGMNNHEEGLTSISMTATTDKMGNLVLGSSRQFTGFNTEVEKTILNRIWDRAGVFFPALRELHLEDLLKHSKIRIGHRPYTPDGKPIIGPVPGLPRVFLATGHEGGGLCLALGTAEMVADMILGNTGKVECAPFLPRCYQ
ncbi:hypothetical protein ACLOJK_009031 [Asimina triloba]